MKQAIIQAVVNLLKINQSEIFEKTRKSKSVHARQLISYYLRNELGYTFDKISKMFELHHATIMNCVREYQAKLDVYRDEKITYLRFKNLVDSQGPLDSELLAEFLKENDKYLSSELKEYLKVRL